MQVQVPSGWARVWSWAGPNKGVPEPPSTSLDPGGFAPQVPNVAVIVTDGRPQDRVAEVAAEAREKGIEIYAVGVARADMTSLRAMASPPFEDHVFLVESFDLIHQFGLQFQDKLCGTYREIKWNNKSKIFYILFIFFMIFIWAKSL